MDKKQQTILTEDTITLFLADNLEVECDILTIFPIKDQFYIALMPQTLISGYEDYEYFLYRYQSDGEQIQIDDITSDEELEIVEDKFEELLDEAEFNQMNQ